MTCDAPNMFARTIGAWKVKTEYGDEHRHKSATPTLDTRHGAGRVKRHGMETGRTKLAETSVVVWALDPPLLRVRVEALVARGAVAILGIPPALWHSPEVVLVRELTCVTFLA